MVHVSVVIVNYNSGAYAAQLVDGLQKERVLDPHGRPSELEIIVVENDSPSDQHEFLDPLSERGIQVLSPGANLGYGGGCNYGLDHACGTHVLFMNPDVFVAPGSIQHLSRYLDEHPEAGQAGPRGWFDCHRFLFLPRIELPTLALHFADAWRRTCKRRAAAFARRRSRNALRIWAAARPQEEPVLAGYAFMMPAELARRLGPFDPRFPLYFEDSDLTRRVRESGYQCVLVPQAEMVHLFNKCAGQFELESSDKHNFSQQLYFEKHYGRLGGRIGASLTHWIRANGTRRGAHEFQGCVDLGPLSEPPLFRLPPNASRTVMELTIDPMFTLAVGRIESRREVSIPEGVWEHLEPTQFYVRFLSLPQFEVVGAWKFLKTAPLRPVQGFADFERRFQQSVLPSSLDP